MINLSEYNYLLQLPSLLSVATMSASFSLFPLYLWSHPVCHFRTLFFQNLDRAHLRPLPGLFLSLVWLLCPKEWLSLVSFCSLLLAASYTFEYMLEIWLLSSLLTVDAVLLTSVCLYSSWITFSDSLKEYLALLLLQLC